MHENLRILIPGLGLCCPGARVNHERALSLSRTVPRSSPHTQEARRSSRMEPSMKPKASAEEARIRSLVHEDSRAWGGDASEWLDSVSAGGLPAGALVDA